MGTLFSGTPLFGSEGSGGGGGVTPVTQHNTLQGRSDAGCHPKEAITGLATDLSSINAKITEQEADITAISNSVSGIQNNIDTAVDEVYSNTVSKPEVNKEYSAGNSWIVYDSNIHLCTENTIWLDTLTSAWIQPYYKKEEVVNLVNNAIKNFEEMQFPLQMKPGPTNGVYQTLAEVPLTENKPGYLAVVLNEPDNGIYIWGVNVHSGGSFGWLPFVVIDIVTQDNLQTTFNGSTNTLKVTMANVQTYVDQLVQQEATARSTAISTLTSTVNTNTQNIANKQNSLTPEQLDNIAAVPNKVDSEVGKGLSTNDFTDAEKTKLGSLTNYNDTDIKTQINKNTADISTKQDTLTAGTGIDITDNVISAQGGGISEAVWGEISGTLANQTDLQAALDNKANTSDIPDVSNFVTDTELTTALEAKQETLTATQLTNISDVPNKQDKEAEISATSEEVSSGIDLVDNAIYTIEGPVTNFVINSATGSGIISFTAGTLTNFTLPGGWLWAGGSPIFTEGRKYNVVYFRGTFYRDEGV